MALLDIGTGAKGDVIVTDDDVIEMSNLSRQFLFTEEHVGVSGFLEISTPNGFEKVMKFL